MRERERGRMDGHFGVRVNIRIAISELRDRVSVKMCHLVKRGQITLVDNVPKLQCN